MRLKTNTKNLVLTSILTAGLGISTTTLAAPHASQGYSALKDLISQSESMMQEINLYTAIINASADIVNADCPKTSTALDTQCALPTSFPVTITQAMKDADPSGNNVTGNVGDSFTIPTQQSITITYLSTGKFDNAITLKESATSHMIFRWDDAGTSKSVSYKVIGINGITNISLEGGKVVFSNSGKLSLGSYTTTYNLKLKETDASVNGVKVKAGFTFDNNTFSIVGNADNNGGFVQTTVKIGSYIFTEKETFDSNGSSTAYVQSMDGLTWQDANGVDTSTTTVDSGAVTYAVAETEFDSSVYEETITGTVAYSPAATVGTATIGVMIVKKGETPNSDGSNVLGGGIYGYIDGDGVLDIELDYFGDTLYLGTCSSSDNDNLDVYEEARTYKFSSDNDNLDVYEEASTYKLLTNICLKKK